MILFYFVSESFYLFVIKFLDKKKNKVKIEIIIQLNINFIKKIISLKIISIKKNNFL